MKRTKRPVRRGQIWNVDWSAGRGSEQHGRRPSLIVQTDAANELEEYELMIVVAISGGGHEDVPFHIKVGASRGNGLSRDSFVKCEQIQTISRFRLAGYLGTLERHYVKQVDNALKQVLELE